MTFPLTSILDNFNRADGSLGANWLSIHAIISNQVAVDDNSGSSKNSLYNAVYSGNVEGFITLTNLDGAIRISIILDKLVYEDTTNDDQILALYDDGLNQIEAYYWNGSSFNGPSVVGGSPSGVTFSNGDVLGACVFPDIGILAVYKNGVFIVSYDVSGYANLSGGYIGFRTSTPNSTVIVDDFGGGVLSPDSAIAAPMFGGGVIQ